MSDARDHYFEIASEPETSGLSERVLNGRACSLQHVVWDAAWLSAASSDAGEPQTFDLARLWREVSAGTWRFGNTFSNAERHFALIECASVAKKVRGHARNLEILERVLLGHAPKVVAMDLNVAPSTVAAAVKEALSWTGLRCSSAKSPVMLTMAARAARDAPAAPILGRLTRINAHDDKHWLVSVERPDLTLPVQLSHAEAMVIRLLVAGRSHAEISTDRATSRRTVANQLAAAFRKFGASGRVAIIHQLITHSLKASAATATVGTGAAPWVQSL